MAMVKDFMLNHTPPSGLNRGFGHSRLLEGFDSGRLRLNRQKIHRVKVVRLNLLKPYEIIERH